ncbi:hypothetical protein VD0002_g6804 [Verticillium dahliae]|nr:hypothetical protein VD0003_g5532 [Verticillium dahliae]PNH60904.1 hypothetical protein VD0002_g6804 [Verticillium dahliae]
MWSREGAACREALLLPALQQQQEHQQQHQQQQQQQHQQQQQQQHQQQQHAMSAPITFYDIGLRPPAAKNCCSPNPWKTRFALNFKALAHTTKWVALPDIVNLRTTLQVAPTRKFADGSDFFTLPIIEDASTGTTLGDSLDIAVYLQQTYPSAGDGDLFPDQPLDYAFDPAEGLLVPLSAVRDSPYPAYATFNVHVDGAFTAHTQLTTVGFPFDPANEAATKAIFVDRARPYMTAWEDFALRGDDRARMLASFEATLAPLAVLYGRDAAGPFLLGARASYADFIVGAWLRMFDVTLPAEEWQQVRGWHGGIFGRLHDGLQAYAEVK